MPAWKVTIALRGAPSRASSKQVVPPKQKPMAAFLLAFHLGLRHERIECRARP